MMAILWLIIFCMELWSWWWLMLDVCVRERVFAVRVINIVAAV